MKKPKKIIKYEADGYIFNTFQELKNYVYFNTSIKMKKICYELDEDVIPAEIDDALYDLNVEIIESIIDLSLKIGTEENSHEIAEYVMNVNFYISRAKKIIELFYVNDCEQK